MGWFLTRSKGRGKRTARRSRRGPGPRPWDPQRTLLGLKILGGFALAVGLAVGWRYGDRALASYVRAHHAQPVAPADVTLADAPPWMTEAVRLELQQLVADPISANPMDGASLRRAAEILRDNPWVSEVRQVRRLDRGDVIVEASYREPVAIVEARDGYHLVDAEGVRLPGLYFPHQVTRLGLPIITGVASAPRSPGEVWPGLDVQAGLSLVTLLSREAFFDQVRAVDVSHRDPRGRIRLILYTDDGLVRWGLPPGEERAIEPDAQVKLRWLRRVAEASGGAIDAGGKAVDVYGATVQISTPPVGIDGTAGTYTTLSR